ncbi:MAG: S8 family serine peptidase, partial [Candidatus Omnitrophica bacterium]|nr:S8 family serine peptidase [Candidatus Omnitrophota bacterium]
MKNLRSKKRGSVSNRLLIVLGLGVMGIFLAVCLKLIFLTHKPSVLPLRQEINLEGPTAKKEEAPLSFVEKEAERKEFVLQKNFLSPSPKVVTRITSQEPEFVQRLEEEGIKVEKLTKVAELKPEIFSQGRQKLTASETRDYFKFPYISGELIVMTNEGGYLLEVEKGEEEKTADLLSEEKEVIYAVPNTLYPLRLTAFPENPDPGLDYEWHLIKIEATQAWGISQGEGVKVAVLDTGIDLNHPDLKDNLDLETSYDYVDNDPLPEDILGHGTMIAGT